jgi:hypothetical protein
MKRLLLVLPLVLAVACSGSTEPSGPYGIYRLQSIDGQPVPYVSVSGGNRANERILATSEIELSKGFGSAGDKYAITWAREFLDPATGVVVGQDQFVYAGLVVIEGSTLHFDETIGTLTAGEITVTGFLSGNFGQKQLVFKR